MAKWLLIVVGFMIHPVRGQMAPDTTSWISGKLPRFRTLTVADGLSQSSIVDVTQDETGYWWMATQDGLNRYDGRHITFYEKYFEDVTRPGYSRLGRLFVDQAGDLWLIPATGVAERRNARTGHFEVFPFLQDVSSIFQDSEGRYWASTYTDKLLRFDPQRGLFAQYPVSGTGYDIIETRNGKLWLAASSGLYWYDTKKDRWIEARVQGAVPSFSRLCEQGDGTLWAGTHSQGLYRKGPDDQAFQIFTGFDNENTLSTNLYILALLTDRQQKIWVGTYGQGVYQLDTYARSISHFKASKTLSNALAYDDVLDIFEDRTGVIGVSTDGGGISMYDPLLIKFGGFTANQVPPSIEVEQVRAICTDRDQTLWLGTSGKGLTCYTKKGNWTTFRLSDQESSTLSNDRIMSLLPNPDGTLWVGTQGGGLARFDPSSRRFVSYTPDDGFPDHTVWCLFRDSRGWIWAGTQNAGLLRLDGKGNVLGQYQKGILKSNDVRVVTEGENGNLWVASEGMGLHELDPITGEFRRWDLKTKVAGNVIKSLYYDAKKRVLWIGTLGGGLIRFENNGGNIRQFTIRDGLPNNVVYGILPDEEGYLWLSTNKGICRFRDRASGGRPVINRFTTDDGLQSMEFNTGAFYRSPEGVLYFGGVAGFNGFRPGRFSGRSLPPEVAITAIDVNGLPISGDTLPEVRKTLTLGPDQKTIAVTVAALHFSLPMRNRFRYRLDGYDTAWNNAGTRNYIRYTNLPADHYTLRVQSASYDGVWSTEEARLGITIEPYLWQRWWFILLMIATVGGILYGLYRYRINELMRIQTIRNRLSADLHDEIGSSLSSIGILGTLAGSSLDKQHPAFGFVNRITEESRQISRSMADIVWSINPRNDELESLLSRMNRYAAELLEARKIDFTFDIVSSVELNQLSLSMEQRRDLYLLFKESINNLIKYSQCTRVQIEFRVESPLISLMIQDNGVGFDPYARTGGNGLYNMRQRAGNLKGKISIDSSPGAGTTILLVFPFNQITHKGYWM